MAASDKATAVSGVDIGDAARRRNVAAPQSAAVVPKPEADDKKKPAKKVRALSLLMIMV
jgi:dolichyl-phosphate-mannose-protein mannosyltransferase